MFYQTEAKPQCWRAVAVFDDRPEQLLYLNRSSTRVLRRVFAIRSSNFWTMRNAST